MQCFICENARQAADKSRLDVVGCRALAMEEIKPEDVRDAAVYQGWFYGGRRPGDVGPSDSIGHGATTNAFLVEADGTCKKFAHITGKG